MPRTLSQAQLTVLLAAWHGRVYQRESRGYVYSWNTATETPCRQQTDKLYPEFLMLVDLPTSYGLNSRRFLPTKRGEEILARKGLIDQ